MLRALKAILKLVDNARESDKQMKEVFAKAQRDLDAKFAQLDEEERQRDLDRPFTDVLREIDDEPQDHR